MIVLFTRSESAHTSVKVWAHEKCVQQEIAEDIESLNFMSDIDVVPALDNEITRERGDACTICSAS